MKIGIILGSVRDGGRIGEPVSKWVLAAGAARDDAEFDLLDLKAFDVPLLTATTPPAAAGRVYDSPQVTRWGAAVDDCDAFVFVTPEYNHGVPGAFKNAVDSLGPEWTGKPVAFVSYGADGGIRAVEQWRQIVANFHMVDVRAQVALSLFFDFDEASRLAPMERRQAEIGMLLDQLVAATALRSSQGA